jgi:exodeoxyribonuclease VIII
MSNATSDSIIYGMPEAQYHAHGSLGSSSIKKLCESPRAYDISKQNPMVPTDSMDFGSAFHMMVLEPELFAKSVLFLPDDVKLNTKDGKIIEEGLLKKAIENGVTSPIILKNKDKVRLEYMAENLPIIKRDFEDVFAAANPSEVSLFWQTQRSNVTIKGKGRFDKLVEELNWNVDVKTTSGDLDDHSIQRTFLDFNYGIQGAWYSMGYEQIRKVIPDTIFIVFQTKAPYGARVVIMPQDYLAQSKVLVERALENYVLWVEAKQKGLEMFQGQSLAYRLAHPKWFLTQHNINVEGF